MSDKHSARTFFVFLVFAAAVSILAFFMVMKFPAQELSPDKASLIKEREEGTEDDKIAVLADNMAAHKALYDIQLISSHAGSQIINISGEMYFEFKPTCDAWTTDHRFNLRYEYADSPAMHVTSDFSTWESKDGREFNFSSRRSRDGEIYEELRGHAELYEDGTGRAVYTMPEGLEYELPKSTMFPMHHTELVSRKIAGSAKDFIHRPIFDGSDQDGPLEINAFVGAPVNVMARLDMNEKIDANLINSPARNVRMAFFPLMDPQEPDADYEMEAVAHANSVISEMKIFYDEFSVQQNLLALEQLEVNLECEN